MMSEFTDKREINLFKIAVNDAEPPMNIISLPINYCTEL